MKFYRIDFSTYTIEEIEGEDLGPHPSRGQRRRTVNVCLVDGRRLSYLTTPRVSAGKSLFSSHKLAMTSMLWEISRERFMYENQIREAQKYIAAHQESLDKVVAKITAQHLHPPAWEDIYKEVR